MIHSSLHEHAWRYCQEKRARHWVTPFTLALPEYFGSVHALDLTNAFATRCSRRRVNLISGDITQENATTNVPLVDCIFFLEVIEHLHVNPVDLLGRLRSRLTEGGVLMVSTCNMMCLGNRVRMLCNRKLRHFDYPPFQKPQFEAHGFGHDRIYSPTELREYLENAGFRSIDTLYPLAGDAHLLARGGYSPGLMASYALKRVFPSFRDTMLLVGKR
jgi:hypothetical protein